MCRTLAPWAESVFLDAFLSAHVLKFLHILSLISLGVSPSGTASPAQDNANLWVPFVLNFFLIILLTAYYGPCLEFI